jgi:hypothetical protein
MAMTTNMNIFDTPILPAKHRVFMLLSGDYGHVWEREGRYVALRLPEVRPGRFQRFMVNDAFHRAESPSSQ